MNKIFVAFVFLFCGIASYTQISNNNPKVGRINIDLPKTPESQAFEKYGNISVSEFTGSPNISVPIYSVKSRFLQVPIALSYNASGIKVSQEASWVGLGFDIIAGGRITVETKGCIDKTTGQLISSTTLKSGMQKLFSRLGNTNNMALLTYGSTCHGCDTSITHSVPDDATTIEAMAQFGVGEPDIYRANFMGQSLTFYFDILTDSLRFLGEKSLVSIVGNKDVNGMISDWAITDNSGNSYFFAQIENTTQTSLPLGSFVNPTSTTAWLLTKIQHPTGDAINFIYTNYGTTYPANNWSASMSFMETDRTLTFSNDYPQATTILSPAYLTKIETDDVAVNFVLGNRDDLKGAGSRRLDEIRITDKQTNTVRRKISFNYDYFTGGVTSCFSALPAQERNYRQLRLKLNTLTLNDSSAMQPPYQFFYNNGTSIPEKYSFAQDHWGFCGGSGPFTFSDPCSPKNMIPNTGLGTALNYPDLNGYTSSRDCNPLALPGMSLDSIVYPTGGSTKFFFEAHQTVMLPNVGVTGGGQRIKTIKNYNLGKIVNTTNYTYGGGVYNGTISYYKKSYQLHPCPGEFNPPYSQISDILSSNGAINDNDLLIFYSSVNMTQTDENGVSNGYIIKRFNAPRPTYGNTGYGFDALAAHWPAGSSNISFLYPSNSGFAPTPKMDLDGKLMSEEYYDGTNTLLKATNYYYTQTDYSNKFYNVKAIDNRIGGFDATGGGCGGNGSEFETNGTRRFTLFVSPAKSFYTLTDSVVEKIYHGTNFITQKKVYKYNSYFQPAYESVINADGTQTITYTRSSLGMPPPNYPLAPSGDALLLYNLKSAHIYDLPIEQTVIKRNVAGDSTVVQSRLNIYQNVLPLRVYMLETSVPLTYKTQFIPSYYTYSNYPNSPTGSIYTLQMDSKYKLYSSAVYAPNGQIKGLYTLEQKSAYIWDTYYNDVLAQVANADSGDIAYTSFETSEKGRWSLNAVAIASDNTSPTGNKCYSLASGNISIAGLNSARTYNVSYWSKTTAQSVNGASATIGNVINGWTYFEHQVINPAGGNITVSGIGLIDELRLYPINSLMTSYTYAPIIGLTSQADVNNRISYYEYDAIGRVSRIRDAKRNVLKQYEYKYRELFNFTYGNSQIVSTASISCPNGYASSIPYPYTVKANTYGSFISPADANQKAQKDVDANGQAWANATGVCTPIYSFVACCGWNGIFNSFSLNGAGSVNFSFVVSKQTGTIAVGTSYTVANLSGSLFLPSGYPNVTVNEGGRVWEVTFIPYGSVYIKLISGSVPTYASVSGTYPL